MGANQSVQRYFGLDESEELCGQFSCAHAKPYRYLQGQVYIFSNVMVFYTNLGSVKHIPFKDVREIRKRTMMWLPNTIAVTWERECPSDDDDGFRVMRQDLLTNFVMEVPGICSSSRDAAYDIMVQCWKAVKPEAANRYLIAGSSRGPLLPGGSSGWLSCCSYPGSITDLSGRPGPGAGADSATTSDSLTLRPGQQSSLTLRPGQQSSLTLRPGQQSSSHQHHSSASGVAPFPAWQELPAAVLPPAAGDMALMAAAHVEGVGAKTFAEVLLSDTSGFLPAAYKAQGNELVGLSPWQVVHSSGSGPPGSLSCTLQYIYSSASAWGTVQSLVVQDQVPLVGEGGRLVLLVTQRMPDLPAGVGKCFHKSMRWDITPTVPAAAAAALPAAPTADHSAPSLHSANPAQQQQLPATTASPFGVAHSDKGTPAAESDSVMPGTAAMQQQATQDDSSVPEDDVLPVRDQAPMSSRGSSSSSSKIAGAGQASENGTQSPDAATADAPAAGGVEWQVRGSVTFTKWHMAQSRVERDCLTTAGKSLTNLVARGVAWLQDEGSRQTLAEVMPQAEAVKAAQRQHETKHGAGHAATPTTEPEIILQQAAQDAQAVAESLALLSGQQGSSSLVDQRVREIQEHESLAALSQGTGREEAGVWRGSGSSAAAAGNRTHLQHLAQAGLLFRAGAGSGTLWWRGSVFVRVLTLVSSVLGAGVETFAWCGRAVWQGLRGGSAQQLIALGVVVGVGVQLTAAAQMSNAQQIVLGVVLAVVVQLLLLWQVVVLQGRVVQLLERGMPM